MDEIMMVAPKILIVDDEPDNLIVLRAILSEYFPDCRVVSAVSSSEGLSLLEEIEMDVILLDVQMPGMSGIEMCRRIKKNDKTAHIPVILITAYQITPRLKVEGLEAGAEDFISKPIDSAELTARIKVMLRIKKSEDILRGQKKRLETVVEKKTQALSESQELLRLAMEGTGDSIWDWNMTTGDIYLDDAWAEFLGYEPGEVCFNLTWWKERIHPDSIRAFENAILAYQEGRTRFYKLEYRIQTKTGEWKWIGARGRYSGYDERGRPCRMTGTHRDITLRKQEEEALRQSLIETRQTRREINALLEASKAVLEQPNFKKVSQHIFDICKRLIGAGGGYVALLNQSMNENEIIYLDSGGLPCGVPHDLPMPIRGMREMAYKTGRPVIENNFPASPWVRFLPQGHVHMANVFFTPLNLKGETFGTIGLANKPGGFVENDARVASAFGEILSLAWLNSTMRESLEESEKRFRTTFYTSPDAISITRLNGEYIEINEGFIILSGFGPDEVIGKTSLELNIWADPEERKRLLSGLSAHHSVNNMEMTFRCKDGTIREVLYSARLIHLKGEDHILSIKRDISDWKKAGKERRNLEKQLYQAQKLEALGTLAGGIAHDFNNILFPIIGYTEMAMEDAPDNSILKTHLEEIFGAAKRASELVKQILAISRQRVEEPRPFKIQTLVKEVLKLLRAGIPSTIRIVQNIDNDCGPMMGDPTEIHQVIMNLCTNAFHAMQETGGELEVTLKQVHLKSEDVQGKIKLEPGPYAYLWVRDTGHGMGPEVLERIFDLYYTTKGVGKGTGLGLSLVHGIVMKNKGDIRVKSTPGKGSCFEVYLPLIFKNGIETEIQSPAPVMGGDQSVLVVDDELSVTNMLTLQLTRLGYRVTTLNDSTAALDLFRSHPGRFDLVITDMTMPQMTGYDLARAMMAIRPDIPVILCTGFNEMINEEIARSAGIKSYLTKPVMKKDLAEAIRNAFDKTG
jgi:PAS domain S-box-containing protein